MLDKQIIILIYSRLLKHFVCEVMCLGVPDCTKAVYKLCKQHLGMNDRHLKLARAVINYMAHMP